MKRFGLLHGLMLFALSSAMHAWAADPLFPSGLDWKVGTKCTYDMVNDGRKGQWVFTVNEAANGTVKGTWTKDDVTVPVVKIDNGVRWTEDISLVHGTAMLSDPPQQWISSPMEPGKEWEGRSVLSGTSFKGVAWKVEFAQSAKVGKWETLKLPVGSVEALKVSTKERIKGLSGNFSGSGSGAYWIGGGACSLKKVEYKNSFGESARAELIAEAP